MNRPRANSKQTRGLQFRAEETENGIELSISSDLPYLREYGYEVLVHSPEAINLERMENGAAVLLDHDPKKQVGVVEKVWLDGNKLRARIRFSRGPLGQEILQDVLDGIRQNVSIGYAVNQWDKPTKREMIDDTPVYKAVRWTPHEMSIVSIPADFSVGVGRSMEEEEEKEVDPMVVEEVLAEVAEVVAEEGTEGATLEVVKETLETALEMVTEMVESNDSIEEELVMDNELVEESVEDESTDEVTVEVEVDPTTADAAEVPEEDEADRSNKPTSAHIRRISVKENPSMKINQDEVRNANIQFTEKEQKQYSISRAVMSMVEGKRDGFEWEVSQEIARQTGREASGMFVPTSVRAYSIGDSNTAGALTFTEGGEFIDFLRNKAVVAGLGATVMSLTQKVALPRATADLSAQWIAEDGAGATFNSASLAQVTLSPKKLATYTGFTREALVVGSYDIENLLRNNIYNSFVTAFDRAALQGAGGNAPTGLVSMSIQTGNTGSAALTYENAIELFSLVAGANADMGNLAYVTTPSIKAKAMATIKSGSTADFIVSDTEKIGLYPVAHSNNVPTGVVFFGDWSQMLMAEFGAIDIVVDPYTSKHKGIIEIGATMLGDINVRQLSAFAKATNKTGF